MVKEFNIRATYLQAESNITFGLYGKNKTIAYKGYSFTNR